MTTTPSHTPSRRSGAGSARARADGAPPAWGLGAPRPGAVGALHDALSVVLDGLRLLWRHGPALLTLYFSGVVAHELAMRGAVRLSLVSAELGMLLLLLAPMSTLTALILMLRVVRPSLAWLGGPGASPQLPILHYLGSMLVPFMVIYYFERGIYDDMLAYSHRVVSDDINRIAVEIFETGQTSIDSADRLILDRIGVALVAIVLGAMVGRWLLARWQATERHPWLGIPGAYLELIWLTVATVTVGTATTMLVEWVGERRLAKGLPVVWDETVRTLGGLGTTADDGATWLLGLLGELDGVLILPVAWLAIGAVVLGHQPPPLRPSAGAHAKAGAYQRLERRWTAAPRAVRWVGTKVTADLQERFTPLIQGERMLLRAGVVPMLLFCLAFAVAKTLPDWLWQLERSIIGPRDPTVWLPLGFGQQSPLMTINDAIGTAVLICLVAAAVDRAVRVTSHARRPGSSGPGQAGPGQAGPGQAGPGQAGSSQA